VQTKYGPRSAESTESPKIRWVAVKELVVIFPVSRLVVEIAFIFTVDAVTRRVEFVCSVADSNLNVDVTRFVVRSVEAVMEDTVAAAFGM
jgi:hypothetical protein